jgi:hypothetical protein
MSVRAAGLQDAASIAHLLDQLGYPATRAGVEGRPGWPTANRRALAFEQVHDVDRIADQLIETYSRLST